MALVLHVDGERWRDHLRAVHAERPGLVPVVKGNGYGFGLARLARRAQWLGVETVAVGTYEELPEVHQRFPGSLVVLSPWRPFSPTPGELGVDPGRVVHTVGRPGDLAALVARSRAGDLGPDRPRVLLERLTSMLRHGLGRDDLHEAARLVRDGGLRLEGVALHLPLPSPRAATSRAVPGHVEEVDALVREEPLAGLLASGGPSAAQLWVSHLGVEEQQTLAQRLPGLRLRPRTGTGLWLGDRGALRVGATVLDVHPVERGQTFGYRQRSAPRRGHVVVVSGGTSHGIGLEAPVGEGTLKARAATIARGSLDAAGLVRSPFTVGGKQRLFAEPPHMQVSMLLLPHGSPVPEVGDEVGVRVRYTTTTFDRVAVD
ncbi:alanine racemase [Nocardioides marmoraquaticus]